MGLRGLIQVAMTLAVLASATGQLPRVIHVVRVAQLHLIQDSQASKWGRAMLLDSPNNRR
jgi:hypothetical protein